MKFINSISVVASLALAFNFISCSKQGTFKVDGTIEGAPNTSLMLQTTLHGRWITIDSTKTGDSGKFSYTRQSPESPEIYRLVCGTEAIYFPVDSVDHITVSAVKSDNSLTYTLTGSPDAEAMTTADALVRSMISATPEQRADTKRELSRLIVANPAGNAAYYILNKEVGGALVYDPADAADNRIYGAVANAYSNLRPNDPRTPLMLARYLNNRKVNVENVAPRDTLFANEARILEINLPDNNGTMHSLTEVTDKGKVVVLNFTVYEADESPAFNKLLSDLYTKYSGQGFEIYQVALDSNVASWKLAAQNLPWITVYDEAGINSRNVLNYNVGVVPLSFVIDRAGEVKSRVVDQSKLEAEIRKAL